MVKKSSRKNIIVFTIILLVIIISVGLYNKKIPNTYLVDIDVDNLEDRINSTDEVLIYVGRPTCEECKKFLPNLKQVTNENKKTVFYLNTDEARIKHEDKLMDLLEMLEISVVPTVVKVKNGKIINRLTDYNEKDMLKQMLEDVN